MNCPACERLVAAEQWPTFLCEECWNKGLIWAARMAV